MSPFRDATAAVAAEAAALEAQRTLELHDVPAGRASVFVRRTARIAFGVIGCTGATVMAIAMLLGTGGYTVLLLLSWIAALAAYPVAAAAAAAVLRHRLRRATRRHGDPYRDASALRAVDPRDLERDLSARRARASYAWPLTAATLLGPHLVHLLIACAITRGVDLDFDEYMRITGALTFHIFAYGVYVAWQFPRARRTLAPVVVATSLTVFPSFYFGDLAIAALILMSVIVLATSVVIVLLAYVPMRRLIEREST